MSVYRVLRRRYRDHNRGELFETDLDPAVEARAVRANAIEVVERKQTGLRDGTWTVPDRWRHDIQNVTEEAPRGASLI